MKIKKIKDERVIQLNNKIQSETYFIVLFLLVVSIFIKAYVMEMSLTQYVAEIGIIILSIVYIVIRSVFIGYNFMDTSKKGKVMTASVILVLSFIISGANGIKNYSLYHDKYKGIFDGHFIAVLLVTFLSAVVSLFVIFTILSWLNNKGQQKIEKELGKENEWE